MRVRSLEHGWAELEDHGGAQEAQEADPGNINLIHKKTPVPVGRGAWVKVGAGLWPTAGSLLTAASARDAASRRQMKPEDGNGS